MLRPLHATLLAALFALAARPALAADTLVVCTEASPDALNAALSTANTSFDVSEQVADRLVEMQPGTANLRPALAESWDVSTDGLTVTFHLRHGVKWQSNKNFKPTREFNADDVLFTFGRMQDEKNPWHAVGGGHYGMFDSLIGSALKGLRRIDDYTVAFDLKAPYAPLVPALTMQSFAISSAEYAASIDKAHGDRNAYDLDPIGTGPFQLVQYQKDSLIRFRPFHDFWGAKAQPDRVAKVGQLVFSITPDPSVRFARLKANECQIARYPNPSDIPEMRKTPGVVVQEATIASMGYLGFKVTQKPFDDVRGRQALAEAIDLDGLVKAVWQGTGTPTASLVSPVLLGYDPTLKVRAQNIEHARKLLAEAGLADGFSTDIWAIPVARAYMPNGRRAAEMIQADWAKIGVKAKIVSFEWGEYLRRARTGEAPVAMLGGTWDYPDPSQQMMAFTCDSMTNGRNMPRWCNQEYSDLVARAGSLSNAEERAKLYRQAQEVMYREVPLVLFADSKAYVPVRSNVHGFKLHFLGGQPFGGVSLAK